ncbi:leucine-rich repeat and fibronectin type-III domain-containing 5-like [Brachionus plicatilis]|uniref:Leucine-rich repeat and fibronectin type-III domain-containing 5-like n=1 Tax=Brachionus plicatilis TaxID=10195 RepID=A0A3M7T0M0_BRAPC|nr:leucine-rich repeat and fibronectin type-III domain-containing 5-like [Brachionus plicatilis]
MRTALIGFIFFSIQFFLHLCQVCPNQCNCNITLNSFEVNCGANSSPNIDEQNILNNLNAAFVDTIIIRYSNLQLFPAGLCNFNGLRILDLSNNQITSNITGSLFSCLFELSTLSLSSNRVQHISQNAFDFNAKLISLDLSFNRIETIPFALFAYKLQNLQNLFLQGNAIKELDVWYFYLKQIKTVDLRFNSISILKNDNNFIIDNEQIYSSLASATLIDLRNNSIEKFDDDILKLYNICNQTNYLFFIRLLYVLRIEDNPLQCNCSTSFNFQNFFQSLNSKNFLNTNNSIFRAKCTNSKYFGRNIFNFAVLNEDSDCLVDYAFTESNCPFVVTTTSTKSTTTTTTTTQITTTTTESTTATPGLVIPQNLINEPEKILSESNLDYFNDAQIAGYIIGVFGIAFLFFLLMYFLCPIEILAICFDCVPCFYAICPCKSGVKRDKELDLFISFNKNNKDWVDQKLLPFINEQVLVQNYTLHYDYDNKSNQVFSDDVKDKMDRSSCILFILSDAFLINEWNNSEFRLHTSYLITREKTRFLAIQMHDICDEEVDEYFTDKLQIPNFVSIENDEFLFWKKLGYFLYTNQSTSAVHPAVSIGYLARPNDDINFDPLDIKGPIVNDPNISDTEFPWSKVYSKQKPLRETIDQPEKTFSPEIYPKKYSVPSQENNYEILRLNNQYFPLEEENF